MKTVHVQYFAILREERGLSEETVSTGAQTSEALYDELRVQHGFTLPADRIRVALNEEFAPLGALLSPGDRVVFLPPVAGG